MEYKDLFNIGIGQIKGMKAKLCISEGGRLKFVKARPVHFALKAKLEAEFDSLESEGIIEKSNFSEWASPVVPFLKADGSLRIFGD